MGAAPPLPSPPTVVPPRQPSPPTTQDDDVTSEHDFERDDDDDVRSLTSLPEGVTEDDIPDVTYDDDVSQQQPEPQAALSPERLGRGHQHKRPNP